MSSNTRIPEKAKKPGICYALTDDGIELPVVDITHKAFRLTVSPENLTAIAGNSTRGLERSMRIPGFVRSLIARRSILMRATMEASGTGLSGMGTYLFKLGPDNLGAGYAGKLDRRIASSITPVCVRLRLQAMARLICDALAPTLAISRNEPIHLINIAGGPSLDSLNALILLKKEQPELLAGRRISVHVLDKDQAGPHFGARALEALLAKDAPLHGLDIVMKHLDYDWTKPSSLRAILESRGTKDAIAAGSSEGGLFEYGTDHDIVSNLEVLRESTGEDFVMVGSVFRDEDVPRKIRDMGNLTLRTLGLEAFKKLAARAGWTVNRTFEGNSLYHVVGMTKARD